MNPSASINRMKQAVINYVRRNLPRDENQAKIGTISGGRILIGNKNYRYDTAVDMSLQNGDSVCCLTPGSGNKAVIVGKM